MLIIASSCSIFNQRYSPKEYIKWYDSDKNGLSGQSIKNGITTTIKLHPLEYDAAVCLLNKCDSKSNIKSQINASKRPLIFKLRYDLPGVGMFDINPAGEIQKTERMQYLAHQLKHDVILLSNSMDTIRCQNVIFERTPSDMPFAKFELYFGESELSENTIITILNRVLEQEPTVIELQSLNNNLPQIKIKDENK